MGIHPGHVAEDFFLRPLGLLGDVRHVPCDERRIDITGAQRIDGYFGASDLLRQRPNQTDQSVLGRTHLCQHERDPLLQ